MSSPTPRKRVHVFCLTYGEPAENDFWPQFEYSWLILNRLTRRVAPIPKLVTPLLAARRAWMRRNNFRRLGWNSPLEAISHRQAEILRELLSELRPDCEFTCELIREFRRPLIDRSLEALRKDPPDEILMMPLYVLESDFTTGISRTDLETFHRAHRGKHGLPAPRYVCGFGFDERFAGALADFVWDHCREHGWDEERCRQSALILGAHGTVVTIPPGINSGAQETQNLFRLIRKRLRERFAWVRIGWLNHELGGMWTCPSCEQAGEETRERGIRQVVYFPFGFIADNGESMLEGRQQLGPEWDSLLYLPCPNENRSILGVMARMAAEKLGEEAGRESWETIGLGNAKFESPEPPAIPGKPGPLNFQTRTLALCATVLWAMLALFLIKRGLHLLEGLEGTGPLVAAAAGILSIGILKGWGVFARLARKNLRRLSRLPSPAPLHAVFSRTSWIVLTIMAGIGMSLRLLPMADGARGTIIAGIGLSMLVGVYTYIARLWSSGGNLRMAATSPSSTGGEAAEGEFALNPPN